VCVFWGLFKDSEITNSRKDLLPAYLTLFHPAPKQKFSSPVYNVLGQALNNDRGNETKNLRQRSSRQRNPSIVRPELSCCVAWKAVINASDECAASILGPDHAGSFCFYMAVDTYTTTACPNSEGNCIDIKHSATSRNSRPQVNTQPHRTLMELVTQSVAVIRDTKTSC
jgi:hypothetical protein